MEYAGTIATERRTSPRRNWHDAATLAALVVVPLVAISPLLSPGLMATHDGLFHLYRAVELEAAIREGTLHPRWAGDLVNGLGYPVFHFYAPLANYLVVTLHFAGFTFVDALKAAFAVSFPLAAGGMYLWARAMFPPRGALLAAVAYTYSPYLLLDVYVRGDLPEVLALSLVPWVLWAAHRLVLDPVVSRMVVAAGAYALVILTHNLTAFFFTPLFVAYLAVVAVAARGWRSLPYVTAAIVVGLGLSAFYWLPAIGEKDLVQIERAVNQPDFDFRLHFITVEQLFSPEPPHDLRKGNDWVEHRAGIAQGTLAIVGILMLLARRRKRAVLLQTGFAVSCALVLLFFTTSGSIPFWESVPLVAYAQFPWRLLGLASVFLAFLAAGAACLLAPTNPGSGAAWQARLGGVGLGIASLVIVVSALTSLFPAEWAEVSANPTIEEIQAHETRTHTVGTTSRGEFLPIWAHWRPDPNPVVPVERLDRGALPPSAGVLASQTVHQMQYEAYRVTALEEVTLLFRLLYYPLWKGYVDGREVAVTPWEQHGLGWLTIDVPAGEHVVELRVADTQLSRLGNWLSALSCLACLALPAVARQRRRSAARPSPVALPVSSPRIVESLGVPALFAALLLFKLSYLDHQENWFWTKSPPGVVRGADRQSVADFEGSLMSLAHNLERRALRAGEATQLTVYLEPRRASLPNFGSIVELGTGPNDTPVSSSRGLYARWTPTDAWRLGYYYEDRHEIVVPPGTSPGQYTLRFGLYDPSDGDRRLVVSGTQPPRTYAVLDTIEVLP